MIIGPKATDAAIIAGTVTAPAWAPWIENLNGILTTLTLLVGLALGIVRLVDFFREKDKP